MNTINNATELQLTPNVTSTGSAVEKTTGDFGRMLEDMVSTVNQAQMRGDNAVKDLHSGKAKHLHEVMIAVEEADVSLRMLVQMRNRALTAYEEIMRMQI